MERTSHSQHYIKSSNYERTTVILQNKSPNYVRITVISHLNMDSYKYKLESDTINHVIKHGVWLDIRPLSHALRLSTIMAITIPMSSIVL